MMLRKMNPTNPLSRRRLSAALALITFTLFLVVFLLPGAGAQRRQTIEGEKAALPPTILPIPNACCGKKPAFKGIPNYSTSTYSSFTGQIAIATNFAGPSTPNNPSIIIWSLNNPGSATLGVQWTLPNTNFYSHPDWTKAKIGNVLGITLDGAGNIYAAASTAYGNNSVGSTAITPGTGGNGDVYKIDGNTGGVTRLIQTDNLNTYGGGNKLPNKGVGLGQITYSCDYDKLYVSDFEDGKIYRIDPTSQTILSNWDHGQNLPSASPPGPLTADNATNGLTQAGRRVWAVKVLKNRLFYSTWSVDGATPGNPQNEIWSVGLNSTGAFIGSAKRELTIPALYVGGNYSNPVADISFNTAGTSMLLAERSMTPTMSWAAHNSRLLEANLIGSTWTLETLVTTPTGVPATGKFHIGSYGSQNNADGGADYDDAPNGRVWATGDYLNPATVYGLQGLPVGGGTYSNSILIDLNNTPGTGDKRFIGDVEIPCYECGPPKPVISGPDTTCAPGTYCIKTGPGVTYSWNVTGGTVQQMQNGCIKVTWGGPGTPKTITVTATDASGCSSTTTLTLKDCDVLHQGDCCTEFKGTADLKGLVYQGSGIYNFTASVTAGPNIIRVTADIISTSLTYSSNACGTAGPVNGYVLNAGNAGTLTGSVPVLNGHEAIWYGAPANIVNVNFPMQIKFPPPPVGGCKDYLTFCVKYTFTDRNCKTCEVIVCYGPFTRGGLIKINDDIKNTLDPKVAN